MKMIVSEWFRRYWIHILSWLIFIFYETIVVGLMFGVYGSPITYILHYSINISFFYFNALITFQWALSKQKLGILSLPLILISEILAFISINYAVDYTLVHTHIIENAGSLKFDKGYTLKVLYRCIYFLSFSTAYYFLLNFLQEKNKTSKLEQLRLEEIIKTERMSAELSKAQNSFLKAQINPHFLFNTLDYIYHNIDSNADNASNAIIILAKIMRYAIDATHDEGFVSLGDEIEQIENLILLYQLRKANTLCLDLLVADETRRMRFIPLVLLTLMENIIKHGNLSRPEQRATMAIYIENQFLNIFTDNLTNNSKNKEGTNNGMSNTKNRLRYAFGDSITFEYKTNEYNHFTVSIRIPINKIKSYQRVGLDHPITS